MIKFTFDTKWPVPFDQEWKRSSKRFDTIEQAAKAMSDWMIVSYENGTHMSCRLVSLREE